MEILPVDDATTLEKAVSHLKKGGIIVYPTETSYGIGCCSRHPNAIEKIIALKGDRASKYLISLVNGVGMARKYAQINEKTEALMEKFWPGPLTFVVKATNDQLQQLATSKGEISLRHSSDSFANALVTAVGEPIVSTSANLSGKEPCFTIDTFIKQVGRERLADALLIDAGELAEQPPSTIVRASGESFEVLRQGAVSV